MLSEETPGALAAPLGRRSRLDFIRDFMALPWGGDN